MRLLLARQMSVLLLVTLIGGCGRDSKPTPPSDPEASPSADATAPVSAELDKYMRDGNVFVEDEPIQSFSAVVDLKSGSGRRQETRLENWTATQTVSFVRDTPEGKLFKVVYEVRSPVNKLGPSGTWYHLLAHDGLYSSNASGAKVGSIPSIPAELAVGKEWSGVAEGASKRFYKIEAKETVEVPAGKFEAFRIVSGIVGQPQTSPMWYTPGVGVVKKGQDPSRPGLKEVRMKK